MSRRPRRAGPKPGGTVRIVGGRWRGTRLPVADVEGLRPTADRMRETLFNWLASAPPPALAGARVLDLFAGSGALGLEAVSRGAREAFLVERDPKQAASLHATVERLHAADQLHVIRADALAWLQAPLHGRFDIVFLDPPFAAGLWAPVLARLAPWLADDAWLYLESAADAAVDPGPEWTQYRAGAMRDARHALYRRAADAAVTLAAGTSGASPGTDGADLDGTHSDA